MVTADNNKQLESWTSQATWANQADWIGIVDWVSGLVFHHGSAWGNNQLTQLNQLSWQRCQGSVEWLSSRQLNWGSRLDWSSWSEFGFWFWSKCATYIYVQSPAVQQLVQNPYHDLMSTNLREPIGNDWLFFTKFDESLYFLASQQMKSLAVTQILACWFLWKWVFTMFYLSYQYSLQTNLQRFLKSEQSKQYSNCTFCT